MKYRIEVDDEPLANMATAEFDSVPREPEARRRIAAALRGLADGIEQADPTLGDWREPPTGK